MSLETDQIYEFGRFRLDPLRRLLTCGDEPLSLTSKVFDTLWALVRYRDRVLLKDELMKMIWPDSFVEEVNLAQNISALRKVLGEAPGENRYIATIPGKGYRFVAAVTESGGGDVVVERHTVTEMVVEEEDVPAAPVPKALPPPARRAFWIVLAAAAILGAAVAAWFGWRQSDTIRSVAVLPMRPLGAGAAEALGLGMTDAVITRLTNIRRLIVRPTSSVLAYGERASDPQKVGRELAVDAVLDGKVQQAGNRVRVSVQLVRVRDGRSLWAENFDDDLADLFTLEDSISRNLTQALAVRFGVDEGQRLSRHYTEDMEAYQHYVEARFFQFRFTPEGWNQAIAEYNRAVARDAGYALAYAGLADAYATASDWMLAPRVALPKAEAAARKALAIDGRLAEAHAALAHSLLHEWRLGEAGREFQTALDLMPNNTLSYFAYAEYLSATRQYDRGYAMLNKALEIDPVSVEINCFLPWGPYIMGDYDAAVAGAMKSEKMFPEFWLPYTTLGMAYSAKGQFAEAIAAIEKGRTLNPDSSLTISSLAAAYAGAGQKEKAQTTLADLLRRARTQYIAPLDVATVYAAMGEKDEAFGWLDRALEDRNEMLLFLDRYPPLKPLRGDARFEELVRKVKGAPWG